LREAHRQTARIIKGRKRVQASLLRCLVRADVVAWCLCHGVIVWDVGTVRKRKNLRNTSQKPEVTVLAVHHEHRETRVKGLGVIPLRRFVIAGYDFPVMQQTGSKLRHEVPRNAIGHWLPSTLVGQTAQYLLTWRVDLVPHQTDAAYQRDVRAVRATAGDWRVLARPVDWTVLWVDDKDNVHHVEYMNALHRFHVTGFTVEPLPSHPGKGRRKALTGAVRVFPNVLVNLALAKCQQSVVFGQPKVAGTVARVVKYGTDPKQRNPRLRVRTPDNDERLQQVRRVHEAAPRGMKVRTVMDRLGLTSEANAQRLIRKSQDTLNWGVRAKRNTKGRKK
jgi:hypothetical protein